MIIELFCIMVAAGAVSAVIIHWQDIITNLRTHKLRQDDIAVLIKERINNGRQVTVHSRIFKNTPYATSHYEHTWVGDAVDAETEELFGQQNKVEISL